MKVSRTSGLVLALALAACGGGGGSSTPPTGGSSSGGSSGGGTPTPTPTPTSTPVAYTKFAELTGNQQFKAGCAGLFGATERIDAFGFGRADTVTTGLSIDYTASSQSWTTAGQSYAGNAFSYEFTPAMLQAAPNAETTYYRKDNPDGSAERFYISSRVVDGIAREYVRGALLTYRFTPAPPEFRYCVFGVPTTLADARPSTTVSYPNVAIGGTAYAGTSAISQYDLAESSVTISANPSNGQIPVVLTLVGRAFTPTGLSDTRTNLGVYRGTATIDGSVQSFNDAITDGDRALLGGNFGGWFFGPQGIEIGFAFSVKAQNPDGSLITAAGAVTARR